MSELVAKKQAIKEAMFGVDETSELGELIAYLARSGRWNEGEVKRFIDEVVHFFDELPDDFVRRRHLAMQAKGLSNCEIFSQLSIELRGRRFRAPDYSLRQLRRIVYG